jgi:hypothetical protein
MLNSVTNKIMTTPVVPPSSKKQVTNDFNSVLATQTKQTSVTPQSAENIIPSIATKSDSTVSKTPVDFTNMSPNEFNELYKSGHFAELPPIVLPSGLDLTKDTKSQMESSLDTKFNYVDIVEKEIAFNKSVGMPTEYLEKQLNLMKNFNA